MDRIESILAAIYDALSRIPGSVVGVVALALGAGAALMVHALAVALLRRIFTGRPFVQSLLTRSYGPSRVAIAIFVVAALLPAMPFDGYLADGAVRILGVVLVLLLGWIAAIAVDIASALYMRRFYRADTTNTLLARKHVTQVRILKRVVTTLVGVVTVSAALMTFDTVRQYGVSLFASAGAAGLVVGLAARPLFSNLIAGVQLAITQPIRIGDAVIVENEWGEIEEITSTYVVVRVWDLRRLIIPLTYFIEKPFQNWTRDNQDIFGTVLIHADYAVPVARVRKKLQEIVAGSALWDGRVAVLQVTDATERTVELRALVSARSAGEAFDLRCEVREKLIAYLRAECPEALPHVRTAVSDDGARGRDGATADGATADGVTAAGVSAAGRSGALAAAAVPSGSA